MCNGSLLRPWYSIKATVNYQYLWHDLYLPVRGIFYSISFLCLHPHPNTETVKHSWKLRHLQQASLAHRWQNERCRPTGEPQKKDLLPLQMWAGNTSSWLLSLTRSASQPALSGTVSQLTASTLTRDFIGMLSTNQQTMGNCVLYNQKWWYREKVCIWLTVKVSLAAAAKWALKWKAIQLFQILSIVVGNSYVNLNVCCVT